MTPSPSPSLNRRLCRACAQDGARATAYSLLFKRSFLHCYLYFLTVMSWRGADNPSHVTFEVRSGQVAPPPQDIAAATGTFIRPVVKCTLHRIPVHRTVTNRRPGGVHHSVDIYIIHRRSRYDRRRVRSARTRRKARSPARPVYTV